MLKSGVILIISLFCLYNLYEIEINQKKIKQNTLCCLWLKSYQETGIAWADMVMKAKEDFEFAAVTILLRMSEYEIHQAYKALSKQNNRISYKRFFDCKMRYKLFPMY